MIKRELYLSKLRKLRDQHLIKVISGVRRSGKSTLFELFQAELLSTDVDESQIISINFEDPERLNSNHLEIYREISAKLAKHRQNYVFLDEVQNIAEFEKLVDGLFIKPNVDLYITGSNAYFLSGEFATLLTGRMFELKILPLSFAEYVTAFPGRPKNELFYEYQIYGGFPQVTEILKTDPGLAKEYLAGIYNTILFKDVIARKGVNDREVLEHTSRFLLDNIGNFVSPKKIADYMGSNYRKVAPQTIDVNLSALTDSFLNYSVTRYDIKGKAFLQTRQKYYTVDTGLRSAVLGNRADTDRGQVLENIVFLELLRRGGDVWAGRALDGGEVDFVVRDRHGEISYYQVTESMSNEATRQRELKSLLAIDDNNPKYIISGDTGHYNFDGIKQINVIDWLLG
jgi:predicted AAA+ superfamily ATPase